MKTRIAWVFGLLLLTAACGGGAGTDSSLPTVVLKGGGSTPAPSTAVSGGGVTASGSVVAAQEAQLAFTVSGRIDTITVAVGDKVAAGQVLARMAGGEALKAAVSAADLDVLTAQLALDDLMADSSWRMALAQAQSDLASAQDELRKADYNRTVNQPGYRASALTIEAAEARLILAKQALDRAKRTYDHNADRDSDDPKRASALADYENAQSAYNSALRTVNWYKGQPTDLQQSQLDAAVDLAQAKVDAAQQRVADLQNGPDPDQVALLTGRLTTAQDQAAAARAQLGGLELKAAFTGTLGKVLVHPGEWVAAGQGVLVMADLDHLRVQTTDLSERDLPAIRVGQSARVSIKALNTTADGTVIAISPLADTLGGDVVYQTTLDLTSIPEGLKPGMSVDVEFLGGS